jgi:hypothetical protein
MAGTNPAQVLPHIQPRVTDQMNEHLMAEFTREEIKEALDSIGYLKAPGVDGMPAISYKKTVDDTVVHEVLSVLQGGSIPQGWNETDVGTAKVSLLFQKKIKIYIYKFQKI